MKLNVRLFFSTVLFLMSFYVAAEAIDFVQVSRTGNVVKTLDAAERAVFKKLMDEKVLVKDGQEPHHHTVYNISIGGAQAYQGYWLYYPDGLIRILSKAVTPVYRIDQVAQCNRLLGIESQELGKDKGK